MLRLQIYWFRWQANRAARKVLNQKFKTTELEGLLEDYWKLYFHYRKGVEKQPTRGGDLMIHLAAMSGAFYNSLTSRGFSEGDATRIFYQIAWKVYQKMGYFTWQLSGWFYKDHYPRLKKATELFRKYPFNSPSYKWNNIPASRDIVAFNCTRCPVAEYFISRGLGSFCVNTWCAFDYPLAEVWGARLKRNGSIAEGASVCDFKWIVNRNL